MIFPILNNVAELCVQHGVRNVVLCPGSRSAPLILAFARNKNIRSWTFSDERSAAFIAMGMAQQTKAPVVLVCTSGSAAYNFAPAVAEAYFQKIPLIVITADRPAEWIDQFDGQTIHQQNIYGTHVQKYFELPHDYTHPDARWHVNRIFNEAFLIATGSTRGPVHINAPFREPLYPTSNLVHNTEAFKFTSTLPINATLDDQEVGRLVNELGRFKKVLLVGGQQQLHAPLIESMIEFDKSVSWPIAGDILSNLHPVPGFCSHADSFLGQLDESAKRMLAPDLIITFGQSLIAKNLKLFLRKGKPEHWHVGSESAADTFQSLSKIINVSPEYFFCRLASVADRIPSNTEFSQVWRNYEHRTRSAIRKFFDHQTTGEFALLEKVIRALPANCNLHLANSMSVRYANHIGLGEAQDDVYVYSNRGTSGIDGCSSTAVGHALTSDRANVLITGDLAFFYDRNAFWHNYPLQNLYVVVLNNHGGIIFNLIDGPSSQPEAAEFFITNQQLTAKALAQEMHFHYMEASTWDAAGFFAPRSTASILESDSTQALNKEIFDQFRKHLRKTYEA